MSNSPHQEFIKNLQLLPQTIELFTILLIKYSNQNDPKNQSINQIQTDFINICKYYITSIYIDDNKIICPFEEKDFQHIDTIKKNLLSCDIGSENSIIELIQNNINDISYFIRTSKQLHIVEENMSKIKENILLIKCELFN